MKKRAANVLVSRCAEVASKAPRIKAYVLLYEEQDGTVKYHRDGSFASQLGMVELMRHGIVHGLENEQEEEDA